MMTSAPPQNRPSRRYVLVFAAVFLLCFPAFFLYESVTRIAGCDPRPRDDGTYLAYCWKKSYADYEHGAYWVPTEPAAVKMAQQADVLFLGNSRLQYALSRPVLEPWFASRKLRYHVLAFAGEGSRFPEALIKRLRLRPKVVVINFDSAQFFDHERTTTAAAKTVMERPLAAWMEYRIKQTGQLIMANACTAPGRWPRLCGSEDTIYRGQALGHWVVAHRPVDFSPKQTVVDLPTLDYWPQRRIAVIAEGKKFARDMREAGICVIGINVPSSLNSASAIAREQAAAMGIPFIETEAAGYSTFDSSHLDPDSAHRFSDRLTATLAPWIENCQAGIFPVRAEGR